MGTNGLSRESIPRHSKSRRCFTSLTGTRKNRTCKKFKILFDENFYRTSAFSSKMHSSYPCTSDHCCAQNYFPSCDSEICFALFEREMRSQLFSEISRSRRRRWLQVDEMSGRGLSLCGQFTGRLHRACEHRAVAAPIRLKMALKIHVELLPEHGYVPDQNSRTRHCLRTKL